MNIANFTGSFSLYGMLEVRDVKVEIQFGDHLINEVESALRHSNFLWLCDLRADISTCNKTYPEKTLLVAQNDQNV